MNKSAVQVLVWFSLEEVLNPKCPHLHPHMQEMLLHRAPWNPLLEIALYVWFKKLATPFCCQNFATVNLSRAKFSMFFCSNLVKVLMLVQKSRMAMEMIASEKLMSILCHFTSLKEWDFNQVAQHPVQWYICCCFNMLLAQHGLDCVLTMLWMEGYWSWHLSSDVATAFRLWLAVLS